MHARTFASSSMRFVCVWRRPAVSTTTTSRPRARRARRVVGDGGGIAAALGADEVRARPLRPDLELLLRRGAVRVGGGDDDRAAVLASLAASFPIVVVFPVPLTPTTRITAGSWATSSTGGSPKSSVTSSASAAFRSGSSPRASSRRTSSAVAWTPTSPAMSASSSLLPVGLVARVERCRSGELTGEGTARLRERVAQPREEASAALLLGFRGRVRLPEQLRPATRRAATPRCG
jgi:hypothetical protein